MKNDIFEKIMKNGAFFDQNYQNQKYQDTKIIQFEHCFWLLKRKHESGFSFQ